MIKKIWITFFIVIILLPTVFAQTYDQYFLSRIKADSMISKGDYVGAIPFLRNCISEPEMVNVRDEFNFGYAHFKKNGIDTAAMFMKKALKNGFHFQDMGQVRYWSDAGVFNRFRSHKALEGVAELLESNTQTYVTNKIDSGLLKQLLDARENDQRFRGATSDYTKQIPLDEENQKLLKQVIRKHGWPTHDMVGWHGSNAAFLIAQHADNDLKFQLECLEYIRDAHYRQKIEPSVYPYIIDRTRVNSGKPQVFGTQYDQPIENTRNVNLRRKAFGLETVEEYLSKRSR